MSSVWVGGGAKQQREERELLGDETSGEESPFWDVIIDPTSLEFSDGVESIDLG